MDPLGLCGENPLGVYRDPNILGYYSDDPVIYTDINVSLGTGWVGILEPEHGLMGTVSRGQLMEGSTSIVVYGRERTPSSWQAARWQASQRLKDRAIGTGWEKYRWVILNEREALKLTITQEAIEYFRNQ